MIPNGFDLKRFRPNRRFREKILSELGLDRKGRSEDEKKRGPGYSQSDTVLIGLIARYAPIKDHPLFVKAGSLLLEKRQGVHFVLAGRDVTWENRSLALRIPDKWKNHFHLLGERKDVEEITAALDIASLVSYGEGFPNIICEAMACGVPCVVTDVGDSARIVGSVGRVVPYRNPEAVASAWNELIDMGEEGRRRLGLAARKRIKERFDLPDVVRDYENLYASVVTS
jgi:glycosyltransferase involved in cell wall biosynthesis